MSLANCEIINGRQLTGCLFNSVGGIKRVWIANHADVASVTLSPGSVTGSTDEQIVSITMQADKDFYTFDTVKETSNFTNGQTKNIQNGTNAFNPSVVLIFNKLNAATRNTIQMLAVSLVDIIVEDSNSELWYLGRINGMDLTNIDMGTGTAQGDRNGATLTFTGAEPQLVESVYTGGDSIITIVANQLTVSAVAISEY